MKEQTKIEQNFYFLKKREIMIEFYMEETTMKKKLLMFNKQRRQ